MFGQAIGILDCMFKTPYFFRPIQESPIFYTDHLVGATMSRQLQQYEQSQSLDGLFSWS